MIIPASKVNVVVSVCLVATTSLCLCSLLLWTFVLQDDGDVNFIKTAFWICFGLSVAATGALIAGDF